jgi:dTDP-4-amino-4,6-dideoxygalactose transaminase
MTTGEGGAISATNMDLLDKARKFSRQGLVRDASEFQLPNDGPWHQEVQQFGLNYRLPDVLCALGISQIARIEEFKKSRRAVFSKYISKLSTFEWVKLPTEREYVDTNWHLFPVRVPPEIRKRLFQEFRFNGVGVQVNYIPAYRHPVFKTHKSAYERFPASEAFYESEISLPMHHGLTEEELDHVISVIDNFVL